MNPEYNYHYILYKDWYVIPWNYDVTYNPREILQTRSES